MQSVPIAETCLLANGAGTDGYVETTELESSIDMARACSGHCGPLIKFLPRARIRCQIAPLPRNVQCRQGVRAEFDG